MFASLQKLRALPDETVDPDPLLRVVTLFHVICLFDVINVSNTSNTGK